MKKKTHPQYYKDAAVICACGNKFTTGSTVQTIHVELCSKCHPFYTGKQKLVDTENLVRKFEEKTKAASKTKLVSKKEKRAKRRAKVTEIKAGKKVTLKDMLKQFK
ncbi:50S ribosomal protein L31 [Candidatus Dojkabacteria bacterium]|nr:50S ribosomal protein L31 [Candidatus Dojkabacteria bacterium]